MFALRILAIVAALLAVAVPAASAASSSPSDRMIAKINQVRAGNGLSALKKSPKLARTSRHYARHLMKADAFNHGSSYKAAGFKNVGEILAYSQGWSLRASPILRMWLASSVHRALTLSGSFRYVGASPARGRFGRGLTTVWVVHFGAH